MRYSLITGTGRSGTNWLLDMLDVSPQTHCRNEPHGVPGSALHAFPQVWKQHGPGSGDVYRAQWDGVAQATSRRLGRNDHHLRYPKDYLRPGARRLGVTHLMTSPRLRRYVALADRRLAAEEWELPQWVGSRRRLTQSTAVLKVLIDASLVGWLLEERPQVPVVHIVRHPGGRLNSWLTRLVQGRTAAQQDALRIERVGRLARIRARDAEWTEVIPDPSSLSLIESELWFWRYINETTMAAGRGQASYQLIRFDDVTTDPLATAKIVFDHLDLPWSLAIRDRISADNNRSVFGPVADSKKVATNWRSSLTEDQLSTVDTVLAGSPLSELLA